MYSTAIHMYVYMYVCLLSLSGRISQKPHVQTSLDDDAVSYALPFLWITSCFHTMGYIARERQ